MRYFQLSSHSNLVFASLKFLIMVTEFQQLLFSVQHFLGVTNDWGCLRVTLNPGDIFAMPSQYIHTVLTCGDSVAVGTNFLSEGHSTQIMKAIIEEDSFKDHEKFPGMLERLAILMLNASER